MVWLSADCETPSLAAARVKLPLARDGEEGSEVVEVASGPFMKTSFKVHADFMHLVITNVQPLCYEQSRIER